MGSCTLASLPSIMPIFLTILLFSPMALAMKMPAPLGQGTGNDEYKPVDPSYSTPDEVYKAGDKDDCHPVEEIVYENRCLPYVEKTCLTQQQEQCKEVFEKNCTAVIDEFEERECFYVTELMCSLAESIQYEMVDETYTVQRCTGVTDRVCDTVYDLAQSTKDDFQCVDIDYQYCWDEDKVVKDRTCIFSVDFDCKKQKPYDGKGAVQCEKTPTKKCYDTPRKVQEEDLQAPDQQVLREVHQRVPLPRGEAELPHRAHEEVRAGVPHPSQEGQEVYLQQGVQARDQAGVREPRGQETAPRLRQDPEERVQLQAGGEVRGREEGILLQGGEEGLEEGVHPREEGRCRRHLQLCLISRELNE